MKNCRLFCCRKSERFADGKNQNACKMRAKLHTHKKHINVIANINKRKPKKLYRITEIEENEKKYLPKL